jgi:hypothetical protein
MTQEELNKLDEKMIQDLSNEYKTYDESKIESIDNWIRENLGE